MLGDTGNKQAVRILLECLLVIMLKIETKSDRGIYRFDFSSTHPDKCKFALKLIELFNCFQFN